MITKPSRIGVLVSLMCLLSASGASAICAPGIQTARERLATHDAVFVGRVVAIRKAKTSAASAKAEQTPILLDEVVFEVKVAWKGIHEPRVTTVNMPIFEARVVAGGEYLIYAMRQSSDSRLMIMGCGNTKPYSGAADDVESLGKPEYVSNRDAS